MMKFLKKLEEIKQTVCYAVSVFYGEGVGCDDMDVPIEDRLIRVGWAPAGVLGSARMLFVGSVKDFLDFDVTSKKPEVVDNPPSHTVSQTPGFYLWGTDKALGVLRKRDEDGQKLQT